MAEKTQIVFVHGGDSFNTSAEFHEYVRTLSYNPYEIERGKWRDNIKTSLIETHECLMPRFPNAMNAEYIVWSMWFEKVIPYLRTGVVLVGHSLGGGFLLRYLSEHKLPVTISQLHLVAPVIDDKDCPGVGVFGIDIATWSGFASLITSVHLWHSEDDTLVPIHHSKRLAEKYSSAQTHFFTDRGHFLQPELPELLRVIKS